MDKVSTDIAIPRTIEVAKPRTDVATARTLANGGTKLYLRPKPPADGVKYQPGEPGTFLGYVAGLVSVPKWMSSEFAKALDEHNDPMKPEADLNLYSADWFERITYLADGSSPAVQAVADQMINVNSSTQHALSTGCSHVNARMKISRLESADGNTITGVTPDPVPSGDPTDSNVFYGIVSLSDPNAPGNMFEFTIAPLSSRNLFVKTSLHQQQLTVCTSLRTPAIANTAIGRDRESAFDAVRKTNTTP